MQQTKEVSKHFQGSASHPFLSPCYLSICSLAVAGAGSCISKSFSSEKYLSYFPDCESLWQAKEPPKLHMKSLVNLHARKVWRVSKYGWKTLWRDIISHITNPGTQRPSLLLSLIKVSRFFIYRLYLRAPVLCLSSTTHFFLWNDDDHHVWAGEKK